MQHECISYALLLCKCWELSTSSSCSTVHAAPLVLSTASLVCVAHLQLAAQHFCQSMYQRDPVWLSTLDRQLLIDIVSIDLLTTAGTYVK
jgi:hypothetical protein